jgi:ATP-binding protein involved in chromosome partitioning
VIGSERVFLPVNSGCRLCYTQVEKVRGAMQRIYPFGRQDWPNLEQHVTQHATTIARTDERTIMAEERLTQERIQELLDSIEDPEFGQKITDLGMVKDIRIDEGTAFVDLELQTPAHPGRAEIERQIRATLAEALDVTSVRVEPTWNIRASGAGSPNAEALPGVKNTIAVASGKGGVGKSTVAVNMAIALAQDGARVGLLDADVYGPSIPIMMGFNSRPMLRNERIVPLEAFGLKMMSIGFLMDPDKALIWRGPLVAQLITQFLKDVEWGELDYLIIDMPPGTGDAQLTLVQQIPLSGAVIVTTPQDIALADAIKGLAMFQEVKTSILGIVENMSYFVCPNCGEASEIFGYGGGERTAEKYEVPLLGQIPLELTIRQGGDIGHPIVVSEPDQAAAQAFRSAARRAAINLAKEAAAKPRRPKIMLKKAM